MNPGFEVVQSQDSALSPKLNATPRSEFEPQCLLGVTPESPQAYIGTASGTTQRVDLDDHARRFRLGGEKEGAGAAEAVIWV
jgi:hypothetical protein